MHLTEGQIAETRKFFDMIAKDPMWYGKTMGTHAARVVLLSREVEELKTNNTILENNVKVAAEEVDELRDEVEKLKAKVASSYAEALEAADQVAKRDAYCYLQRMSPSGRVLADREADEGEIACYKVAADIRALPNPYARKEPAELSR